MEIEHLSQIAAPVFFQCEKMQRLIPNCVFLNQLQLEECHGYAGIPVILSATFATDALG